MIEEFIVSDFVPIVLCSSLTAFIMFFKLLLFCFFVLQFFYFLILFCFYFSIIIFYYSIPPKPPLIDHVLLCYTNKLPLPYSHIKSATIMHARGRRMAFFFFFVFLKQWILKGRLQLFPPRLSKSQIWHVWKYILTRMPGYSYSTSWVI